jgi:hypothetical protein
MQRNMLGRTADLLSLDDDNFDEDSCLAGMIQRRFMTGVANYHIYKAEICYLYRELSQALVHVRAQDALLASAMSLPQMVRYELISFLSFTASFQLLDEPEQRGIELRLHKQLKRMTRWARHCPTNFLHLKLMMEAELARIQHKPQAALNRLKQSMVAAHTSGFIRDEAFANELKRAAGSNPDPMIVINADATASHQSVIHVLEAARFAGFGRVTFATQQTKK